MLEFEKWKSIQKAAYVRDTNVKYLGKKERYYYSCHRSYGARLSNSTRRSFKSMGSNKIGRACPSTMVVTVQSGRVAVEFYPTHIGHGYDIGRMKLNNEDRNKIAGIFSVVLL